MQYQEQLHTILSRNSRLILLTCCIVAVGILLRVLPGDFILAKPFHLLELDLQDLRAEWRFSLSGGATANSASSRSEVALVTIGDNELDQHGFPMDRGAIADVVTTLKKHSAKVIAFDITFESEWDEVGTKRLARASQGGNVIYPVVMTDHWIVGRDASLIPSALKNHLSPPKDNSPIPGMVPVRLPQETLLSSSVGLGHILAPIDRDGKTRRVSCFV